MFLCPIEDLKHVEDELGELVNKLQNKVIFLTGATGFIGKCLVETLVWLNRSNKLNLSIHSISRSPEYFYRKHPHFKEYSEFHLLSGDIRNIDIPFAGTHVDLLIHAATDVVGKVDPDELFSACIDGTSNVLSFAKRNSCKDFLLLSSGAVYGLQPQNLERLQESYIGGVNLSSPHSAYALGKQASEWLTQQASPNFNVKIARCFAFVGPYLPLDQHFAIGNFLLDALAGNKIEIQGDGSALRTYLYTSDLSTWLLKILLIGPTGGVWNVGGSDVVSIGDLAKRVVLEINQDLNINIHQLPTGNPHRYIPDIGKAQDELALVPTVTLEQAINKTAEWNRKYGKY